MRFKSKIIILFLLWVLIFMGTVYTYGFFSSEDLLEGNKVSTGEFLKSNLVVKMYASVGPLYNGAIPGNQTNYTSNYTNWVNNACKYAIDDLLGNPLTIIGEKKNVFKNIPDNNEEKVSPMATMGSCNFKSWMGSTEEAASEYGTMIHPVVAISNGIDKLNNVKKIKLKEIVLEIGQWDIYGNSELGYFELSQNKASKSFTINFSEPWVLSKHSSRIKTYIWSGKEYVLNQGNPSDSGYPLEVDLIIFDVGSKGNYAYESKTEGKQGLLDVYERITGNGDHYKTNSNGSKTSLWGEGNHMNYHTSGNNNIILENAQRIPLKGIKTKVNIKYNNKNIELSPYLINIGEV